jgi:membrane protein implicated in regulation of membrane protease activity
MERFDHGYDVVAETGRVVVDGQGFRLAGRTETAPGDSVNVVLGSEFRRDLSKT